MANNDWRKRLGITYFIIGICVIFITCFSLLRFMYAMDHVSLQSTWRSEETGQELTFTDQDCVQIKGSSSSGIYHILSPDTMEYTIDGKTFKMIYHIEGKKLYWGLDENSLECFRKVWF